MFFSELGAFSGLVLGITIATPVVFCAPELPDAVEKAIEKWGIAAFVITFTLAGGFVAPLLA